MNEEHAESDRLKAAFAALGESGAPTAACPEPDRLWAAAAGEGTAEERQEVIDHMGGCASCAAAFRLARRLVQTPAEATGGTDATIVRFPIMRRWLSRPGPLAALAAVLVLAILVPSWLSRQSRTPPVLRNSGPSNGDHTIQSQLAEGAALPRDHAVLRWSAGPPGSFHEVRVSTRQAQEVAVETGLETPQYQVPPESLAGFPAGTVLYWQVTSRFPDGTSGTSPTFSFKLQ
jgi:hypothetical protein